MVLKLSAEHKAALKAYALRNGRFWKRRLLKAWMNGRGARSRKARF